MTYPRHKNKHLEEALFNPGEYVDYKGLKRKDFPSNYIFTYQTHALNYFRRKYKGRLKKIKVNIALDVYIIKGLDVGFLKMPGIGAPQASVFMEELIGLGGRRFINIGTAGGLQDEGIYLCNKAVRDEGTSYHYIPHGHFAYPDRGLTKKLGQSIKEQGLNYQEAPTWTIDAPYRETKAEIKRYKKQGIATVEMEAAALFAVATVRKVKIASAFSVSDVLGEKWEPKFHERQYKINQHKLLDAAVECLK